jgi:hypothetical protein
MAENPPIFPTTDTTTGTATMLDFFACKLYSQAIEAVRMMSREEMDELAAGCGIGQNANGSYKYDFSKMFALAAYDLADGMLAMREQFLTPSPVST